jgi:hypothetical protein
MEWGLKRKKKSLKIVKGRYPKVGDIPDVIKSLANGVDSGLEGSQYELKGSIKVRIAIQIERGTEGKVGFYALGLIGKYNKKDVSTVEFMIQKRKKKRNQKLTKVTASVIA